MQSLSAWGTYPVPAALAAELPLGGDDGSATLLLRDARVGPSWHVAVGLTSQHEPSPALREWEQRVPHLEVKVRDGGRDLVARWKKDRRPEKRTLRGLTTREPRRRHGDPAVYAHWALLDGKGRGYVNVPPEPGEARGRIIDAWVQRKLDGPTVAELPGEIMDSFVLWDHTGKDGTFVAMEIESEPGGIVLAVLLLGGHDIDGLRAAVQRNAWTLAEMASRTYWAMWERYHQRRIGDAIPRVINAAVAAEKSTSPVDLFRCVMPELDPMLLEIAGAMQVPVAGLFLANQSRREIALISHVGYQNAGQPQIFSYDDGLTRLFSWDVKPVVRASGDRRAFHLATSEELDRADRVLGIRRTGGLAGRPRYTSDEWVRTELQPNVEAGPWAWGYVPFDLGVWHAPRRAEQRTIRTATLDEYQLDVDLNDAPPTPAGVIKVHGRIRSQLDTDGVAPFCSRELAALHRWSSLVAAVLQRVAAVYVDYLSRSIVQRAAAALSSSLQQFADYLRDALAPEAVLLLADNPGGDELTVVAEKWHPKVGDAERAAARRQITSAVDGAPARIALSGPAPHAGIEPAIERGRADLDAWNSHFHPILGDGHPGGLLVLVGAPASLQPGFRETSCTRPFPPMLRPTVELLAAMLAGRDELARRAAAPSDHGLRTAWRRLLKHFKPSTYRGLEPELRGKLDQLAHDLAASFRHQHELADVLDVEPQTVRRQITRLTGREEKADGENPETIDWRALGARGNIETAAALARRVDALVEEIDELRSSDGG